MLIEEEEYGKKYRQLLKIGWKILQNINREVTISIMFLKKIFLRDSNMDMLNWINKYKVQILRQFKICLVCI